MDNGQPHATSVRHVLPDGSPPKDVTACHPAIGGCPKILGSPETDTKNKELSAR